MDLCSRPWMGGDGARATSASFEEGEIAATDSSDLPADQNHDDAVMDQHMPDAIVPRASKKWKLRDDKEGRQIRTLAKRWAEVDEGAAKIQDQNLGSEVQVTACQRISWQMLRIKNLYKRLDGAVLRHLSLGLPPSDAFVNWNNDPRRYIIEGVERLVECYEKGHGIPTSKREVRGRSVLYNKPSGRRKDTNVRSAIDNKPLGSENDVKVPSTHERNQQVSLNHDSLQTQPSNARSTYERNQQLSLNHGALRTQPSNVRSTSERNQQLYLNQDNLRTPAFNIRPMDDVDVPPIYGRNQQPSLYVDNLQTQPFNVLEVYRTPPVHPKKIQSLSVIAVRSRTIQTFRTQQNQHLERILRNNARRIGLPIMIDDNDGNMPWPTCNDEGVVTEPERQMPGTLDAPMMVKDSDEVMLLTANEHRRDAESTNEVQHVPGPWQVEVVVDEDRHTAEPAEELKPVPAAWQVDLERWFKPFKPRVHNEDTG